MCFCQLKNCKCNESCLLFIFFLEDTNILKIHNYLPNTFNFNNKNMPIFSRNTLNKFKVFWALGKEFKQKNEIELFFQSIYLEGELHQIFIFLDKVNYQQNFLQTPIINNPLLQKQYQQNIRLILFDFNQNFNQYEVKFLTNRFIMLFIQQVEKRLKETILKISNSQINNIIKFQFSKETSKIKEEALKNFSQCLQNLISKVEKKNSIEYVAKLIQYLHMSRQNIFYVSQNVQSTYSFTNAVLIKFNYEILKNLNDFIEEILSRIQKILKSNQVQILKCYQCNSFGYLTLKEECSFINTFNPSQCECIQSENYQQLTVNECNQNDIETLILQLKHTFSIQYILKKFEQKKQEKIMQDDQNNYKKLSEKLKNVQENLKVLKDKSQKLQVKNEQIQMENQSLLQKRNNIEQQIIQVEQEIEHYEQKSKQLDNDNLDNQEINYKYVN
ncbi:unnamed protein product [Paramecium sonneborni]|uniref:Uncharacterized protein n=1 Tax=Paramecium sonneborni TaxID=65129 RepID=A0A8S1PSX0_9CILI|nr:unnamed protein product [Paramecium sonneborni]